MLTNKPNQTFAWVCVRAFIYVLVHVWEGYLCYVIQTLLPTHLARLAGQKVPRINLLKVARVGITSLCHTVLGLELKSSCLPSEHFAELSL